MVLLAVRVPKGVAPGQLLAVTTPSGGRIMVTVPEGHTAGMVFHTQSLPPPTRHPALEAGQDHSARRRRGCCSTFGDVVLLCFMLALIGGILVLAYHVVWYPLWGRSDGPWRTLCYGQDPSRYGSIRCVICVGMVCNGIISIGMLANGVIVPFHMAGVGVVI